MWHPIASSVLLFDRVRGQRAVFLRCKHGQIFMRGPMKINTTLLGLEFFRQQSVTVSADKVLVTPEHVNPGRAVVLIVRAKPIGAGGKLELQPSGRIVHGRLTAK